MDYPVHQGKLNLHHPISASSGSSALGLSTVEVKSEGSEEVDSLSFVTSFSYSSRGVS